MSRSGGGGPRSQVAFYSCHIRHSLELPSGGPVQLLPTLNHWSLCLPWAPPTPALPPTPQLSAGASRRGPSLSLFSKNSHPCHRAPEASPGGQAVSQGPVPHRPPLPRMASPPLQGCVDSGGEIRQLQAPGQQPPCGLHTVNGAIPTDPGCWPGLFSRAGQACLLGSVLTTGCCLPREQPPEAGRAARRPVADEVVGVGGEQPWLPGAGEAHGR